MRTSRKKSLRRGFTLIEALLSVVILGTMAAAVASLYLGGLDAIGVNAEASLLDAHVRSRMERLIATPYDALANGNETVQVRGNDYTLTWTVVGHDLDGDNVPEADAKVITATIANTGKTLKVLVVNPQNKLGMI